MKKHLPLIALILLVSSALHAEPMNLETAISTAIKNNPGMQAAQAQVEIKGHEQNTAMAHMLPTVTGKYTYGRLEKAQEYFLPLVSPATGQISSPLVAYLATEKCPVTGRVYAVQGGAISLLGGWHDVTTIETDKVWDIDDIAARLPA